MHVECQFARACLHEGSFLRLHTWPRRAGGSRLCSARTRPATTAFTASRWLGFGAMLTRTCRFAAPP